MTTTPEEVDGLTLEQVTYNIRAHAAYEQYFTRKRDAARLPYTKARWQKKIEEAQMYLRNNQERLERFGGHHV